MFDAYDQLVEANPAASELLSLSSSISHDSFNKILPFLSLSHQEDLNDQGKTEVFHVDQYLEVVRHPIRDRQKNLGFLVTLKDITQERQLEQQIIEGALLYDSLTQLPNRNPLSRSIATGQQAV